MYQMHMTKKELNNQLLVGLRKHLGIAQDSTLKKSKRLESLNNVAEVLEYVVENINDSVPEEEQAILLKFFVLLLVKVKTAIVSIHSTPVMFTEEINFITILQRI